MCIRDRSKGKEKLCISQGQLIENVILEAEKAWKGETQVDNILLTAPTGSGKSCLWFRGSFQADAFPSNPVTDVYKRQVKESSLEYFFFTLLI